MSQKSKTVIRIYTLGRVLLFCLSAAVVLAIASRISQGVSKGLSQYLLLVIAGTITLGLTLLFVRWEGLRLSDVGVVPGRRSIFRLGCGFLIGLFLASLQPALILLFGHVKWVLFPKPPFAVILSSTGFYFLVACREELAFRAYPLRSLNYVLGAWRAQGLVAIIFALEHVAGGMTWVQAFFGAGIGAIFFGIAALRSKGLALPIGIHAAWNTGQWALGFKPVPGIWRAVIEKGYETNVEREGFIAYMFIMGLAIMAFYLFWPRIQTGSIVQ
jgi:membrane protease YdiL (CAAX protease family)